MANINTQIEGLFEMIEEMNSKLDGFISSPKQQSTNGQNNQDFSIEIKKEINGIQSQTEALNKEIESVSKKITENFSKIEKNLQNPVATEKKVCHRIEVKSSKIVILILSLIFLLSVSFSCNVCQMILEGRKSDNDLKYRYLRAVNSKFKDEGAIFNQLDSVFSFPQNEKTINRIRKDVYEYEKSK